MKVAVDCERYCVDGSVMLAMQNVCLLVEQAERVERQVCRTSNKFISRTAQLIAGNKSRNMIMREKKKHCHFKETDFNKISHI
jgi:hypothetical protein